MIAASEENYAQCEELLRSRDRDLWLACLFAPPDARKHIHALYAFAQEAADVSGKVTQPLLGEMRLQWWIDALEGAATPGGGARANPIADALIDTIELFALPRDEFIALAEAHVFDLYDDRMPSWSALEDYCRVTASAPMRWAARILGANLQAPSARVFDEAGVALGLTRIARAIAETSGQRKFLPDEAFAKAGDTASERTALRSAIKAMSKLAQSHYDAARRLALDLGPVHAALLPAAVTPLYLERLARSEYHPDRPAGEPSPLRRQWRIWRASRGVGL
ncbi:MAG: squalene/phytoene synthase family protein [Methylocystis sp.]|uniref:phytoene/squalene synthase family protein n=1 Tax=Methylocystis sp. TaxID=1911079 RepID=UPI003949D1FA